MRTGPPPAIDIESVTLADLAAHRTKLAGEAAQLVQELGNTAKSSPHRGALVDRKTSVDRQLKEVNKVLKRRNLEANGVPPRPMTVKVGPDGMSLERVLEPIEPIHFYAGLALHALITTQPDLDDNALASRAWELAEAVDDWECTSDNDIPEKPEFPPSRIEKEGGS